MRKYVIFSAVFVILLGGWTIYWHYDTKHFIQHLPKAPTPTEDLEVTPAIGTTTDVNLKQEEQLSNAPADRPAVPENSSTDTANTPAVLFFQNPVIELGPEPYDTGVTPVLEGLFLGVSLFREDIFEVIAVLDPMINENISIMFRQQEISRELSSVLDNATEAALYEEREALLVRERELSPRIFALQDQRNEIEGERKTFLTEYGVSSWQEFKDIYGNAYQTWKSDQ